MIFHYRFFLDETTLYKSENQLSDSDSETEDENDMSYLNSTVIEHMNSFKNSQEFCKLLGISSPFSEPVAEMLKKTPIESPEPILTHEVEFDEDQLNDSWLDKSEKR